MARPQARAAPQGQGESEGQDEPAHVLYVGRLPHGFYERELRQYFSQFGTVTKVRVSRNKKTARAKHYAFLEFKDARVCRVAAEAMDGYILMERALKCRQVPPSVLHPETFKGANKRFKQIPWTRIARERHNKPRSAAGRQRLAQRLRSREKAKQQRIREAGIDYDVPSLAPQSSSARSYDSASELAQGEGTKKKASSRAACKE